MGQKRLTTEDKIEALGQALDSGDKGRSQRALSRALKDKSNFLVAKAAEWRGQHLHYELIPELRQAYDRFLNKPIDTDKTCAAKRAIVRALYELDYDDVGFFQEGLRYVQLEPVWGGHVDTAVDVRCTCALGLAASNDPRAMLSLIELLHDREPQARIGAISALEMMQPYEAEIVLRYKILQGDPDAGVIAQCFSSLMKVAPEESLEFVAEFLQDARELVRESAALALGESRMDEALDILMEKSRFIEPVDAFQQTIFRAIALQRKEKAFEYLLGVINKQEEGAALNAVVALSLYNFNSELRSTVAGIVASRNSPRLDREFKRHWR